MALVYDDLSTPEPHPRCPEPLVQETHEVCHLCFEIVGFPGRLHRPVLLRRLSSSDPARTSTAGEGQSGLPDHRWGYLCWDWMFTLWVEHHARTTKSLEGTGALRGAKSSRHSLPQAVPA